MRPSSPGSTTPVSARGVPFGPRMRRSWSSSPMFFTCSRSRPAGIDRRLAVKRNSSANVSTRAGGAGATIGGGTASAIIVSDHIDANRPSREPSVRVLFGNCECARAACSVPGVSSPLPLAQRSTDAADAGAAFDVGIAGAGQLARMTCLAAWPLGLRVAVLGTPTEPAAAMAAGLVEGDWRDAGAVAALGRVSGVVTLENEFVDAAALAAVQATGTPVRPDPAVLARVQDKALQKALLHDAGLPTAPFVVATHPRELAAAGRDLGWPLMLKARRLGYDGYGNATCADEAESVAAFARLDAGDGVLVEGMVAFAAELAAMVARSPSGGVACYPVVETVQRDHVCHEVIAPAPIAHDALGRAREVSLAAAAAADGLGVTGVEMFLGGGGEIMVNELAPRPHNSGHYSIEACETSQFENHLRGVLDLPLGDVGMRAPAAAMVNLLGSAAGPSRPDIAAALAVEGAHLHLYDKAEVRPGRKMGHVNLVGGTEKEQRQILEDIDRQWAHRVSGH